MSRSWGSVSINVNEEHELIASLALQHRNGSDASFKVIYDILFDDNLEAYYSQRY